MKTIRFIAVLTLLHVGLHTFCQVKPDTVQLKLLRTNNLALDTTLNSFLAGYKKSDSYSRSLVFIFLIREIKEEKYIIRIEGIDRPHFTIQDCGFGKPNGYLLFDSHLFIVYGSIPDGLFIQEGNTFGVFYLYKEVFFVPVDLPIWYYWYSNGTFEFYKVGL